MVPPVVPAGRMGEREQPVLRAEGNLSLRPWVSTDAGTVVEAFTDPEIRRWHMRMFTSEEEAGAWIARWRDEWRAESNGSWAVARSDTAEILGQVALRDVSLSGGHAECTYWVLPAARGMRVAPRATAELARWALDELGLHRLQIAHSIANASSCRVAEKAGFTLEGTMRSHLLHADGWHDMHLHSRVKD